MVLQEGLSNSRQLNFRACRHQKSIEADCSVVRAETITCFLSICDSYMAEDDSGKGGGIWGAVLCRPLAVFHFS